MRVSSDQWHLVGKHLNIKDLCRLMQVSKDFFYLWIADRAWSHQKERMCLAFPDLRPVFDYRSDEDAASEHTSKRARTINANKKRKKAWGFPKEGTWYVFKRWLMRGTSMKGIKELCLRKDMHPIVLSVVCLNLPFREFITKSEVRKILYEFTTPRGTYTKFTIAVYWGSKEYTCDIQNMRNDFQDRMFDPDTEDDNYYFDYTLFGYSGIDEMIRWKYFLFDTLSKTRRLWSKEFEELVRGEK